MISPASIARHPIHPMLIVFPIGLWVFSFAMDLIYFFGLGTQICNTVAFYTMVGGIVGALAASLPGFMDYMSLPEKLKTIATVHMSINLAAATLYVVNAALRSHGTPVVPVPLILSGVGVMMISISGWLGGEMVYVHGAAVESRRTP